MRKLLFLALLMAALTALLLGCAKESDLPVGPTIEKGSIDFHPDAFAQAMNDNTTAGYYVYTPPSYDGNNADPYPVVYMLHGFGGDENYFIALFSATDAADQLISEGDIEPMVLVFPNGDNAFGGSFYTNSPYPAVGDAMDHITNTIVNEVEANYNVRTDAAGMGIGGHSMGGYGALSIALDNPGMFGSVSVLSAPISFWGTKTTPPHDDATYSGIEEILPTVLEETGYDTILTATNGAGDYTAWRNMMYPSPERRVTAMMFAMTAAFSPFDASDPYYPTLLDSMVAGVDDMGNIIRSAVGLNLPIGVDGALDTTTWNRWMEHDVLSRFVGGQAVNIATVPLYLDVGLNDDLGLYGAHQVFSGAYEAAFAVPPANDTYFSDVEDYDGGVVPADHTTQTYERIKKLLIWHSSVFYGN